jgi:hypothetical protein
MTDVCRLLDVARDLLQRPDPATAGIWPRASGLLARQALETALDDYWRRRAPGLELCSMRAQLLCLPSYLHGDGADGLAERTAYAWIRLSWACHQHVYELPPTAAELAAWIDTVGQFVGFVSVPLAPATAERPGSAKRTSRQT